MYLVVNEVMIENDLVMIREREVFPFNKTYWQEIVVGGERRCRTEDCQLVEVWCCIEFY
jgi:hypothetical protein